VDDTATWVLGSFFFIFVLGFIVYVVATEVPEQPVVPGAAANAGDILSSGMLSALEGRRLVSVSYRVYIDRATIVNYPFNLAVVIGGSRVGPQSVLEDRDVEIREGRLQFETVEPEPVLRVEVRFAAGSLELPEASQEQSLGVVQDTVYSFWPSPVEARQAALTVAISHVTKEPEDGQGVVSGQSIENAGTELVTIPLTISPVPFPIRLR